MKTSARNVLSQPSDDQRVEIAIIGSGPGGAITACILAEAGRDVMLIEEGSHLDLNSCRPFSRDEMIQKYRNGGITVAMGPTKVSYVEGCCVGGGSEINSGLYHRTPSDILDKWSHEFEVESLTEGSLRPHFEACEKELSVSYLPGPAPAPSLKLHEGATRLGWKSQEVPRWFRYQSELGLPGQPTGTKQSMTKTLVPRFLAAGGRLLPKTSVRRIACKKHGWKLFADCSRVGQPRELSIEADTVFVCCGAIQTPALLLRSGFRKNIGQSLHLHPTVKVVAQFREDVNTPGMGVPVHQVKEFAPRFSFGCSISSPPYLALALADHAEATESLHHSWRKMAIYYAMTSGGEGSVRPVPFFRDSAVSYRLKSHELWDLSEGLRRLCRCLLAAGARSLYCCVTGVPWLQTEADLKLIPDIFGPGQANLMTIHLFSTCPMGENRRRAVADSFGRIHGHRNLFISDASLLCGPPGVNPQGSIMALARRNALKFLGRL